MKHTTFSCYKPQRGTGSNIIKKSFVFLIFLCISSILIYNFQIIPALIPFTKAKATTKITRVTQRTIIDCISSTSYDDFIKLTYGNEGNVTSLETNAAKIALINSSITESVINEICNDKKLSVAIPLGNLSGETIFTGKGPDININLAVSPEITCNIESEFYERGINQTLHRIIAQVDVKSYVLLPFSPQEIEVSTKYCIAETVIVGDIPSAYTKINRTGEEISESDIDDIYDFGAAVE